MTEQGKLWTPAMFTANRKRKMTKALNAIRRMQFTDDSDSKALQQVRDAAKHVRKLSMSQKTQLETKKFLSDFQYGYIFEITHIDGLRAESGKYIIAQYSTMWEGLKDNGKLVLAGQVLDDTDFVAPCVMAYFGSNPTPKGDPYYSLKIFDYDSVKNMKQQARDCRTIKPKKLEESVTAKRFSQLAEGSVLTLTNIYKQTTRSESGTKEKDVGTYELLDDKGEVVDRGTIYISERISSLCHRRVPVGLLYMGMKMVFSGMRHPDIRLVTDKKTITSVLVSACVADSNSTSAATAKSITEDSVVIILGECNCNSDDDMDLSEFTPVIKDL